jgi:uncharacterized damage-inducible protein DinB
MSPEIRLLVESVDRGYDTASWHGVNLRGAIRGLSPAQAAWRPVPGRHNIWEIVVHCAYWKYAAWRRLTGARRGSFALDGSNWFERPVARTRAAWESDRRLLDQTHQALRAAVEEVPARELHRRPAGLKTTPFELIAGIAAHDLYHAGQIQLIKRLGRSS